MRRFENNAAQVASEFAAYAGLLLREGVKSYLEIGSQYGGSMWSAAKVLPKGSRLVSIDMPQNVETSSSLHECIQALNTMGYDARATYCDSTDAAVVNQARQLGPFDCVFIDGNHTLPGVTADWQNYGPMGRMVAFHDIVWDRPVRPGRLPIEVSHLWREIKKQYRHEEFIAPGSEKGIGVLWK